jgi:hypothetical protein
VEPRQAAPHPLASLQPTWVPLGDQVDRDARNSGYALFALAAVLSVGAWFSFSAGRGSIIGGVLVAASVAVLVTAVLQLRYPESQRVQAASDAIGHMASGCFKIALILLGVLLLLMGACAVALSGLGRR